MRRMKLREKAAIERVANHFSVTLEEGDDPPDAWLTLGGKRIAVEVVTADRPVVSGAVRKPRLRFDKGALGLVARLQTALNDSVPEDRAVIVTVTAPIRQDSKTTVVLEQLIRSALTSRPVRADIQETIHGNQVRVRVVKTGSLQATKIIGFVHNPDPGAHLLLLHTTEKLLECLAKAAKRRAAINFAGAAWLVIAHEDALPPIETWRQVYTQLSVPTGYRRVLMVVAGGRVEAMDV